MRSRPLMAILSLEAKTLTMLCFSISLMNLRKSRYICHISEMESFLIPICLLMTRAGKASLMHDWETGSKACCVELWASELHVEQRLLDSASLGNAEHV